MARVVRFEQTGGPEVLKLVDAEVRSPGPGELKMAVRALGLNRAEAMYRRGMYFEAPKFPSGIGYEAAGTVLEVGPGVTGFQPGDAVSVIPGFSMNQYGCYGTEAVVPAVSAVKHPSALTFEQAAASWMQYMTAYGALIDIAKVKPGDFVVITAASSSVGLAAIQLVNGAGGIPIAATRKQDKAQALRDHGARHVIVTEEQDYVAEVQRITQGAGARVTFDPVGGPMIEKLADAAAMEGIIFQYGALSPEPTPFPLFAAIGKGLTIRGYILTELVPGSPRFEDGKTYILNGLQQGTLRPVIARTFPLEQIVEAHQYLEGNQQIGKIVVTA